MNKDLRVLIVEDSHNDALLILHTLKQSDYTVEYELVDTEETLVRALTKSWELVLCDYSMPKFTCMDALDLVRTQHEELPFIIVSGTMSEEKVVKAIKRGANDYVNKSHLILLVPAIERVFEEQRVKKENQANKLALDDTKERLYHAMNHAGTGIALLDLKNHFMEINNSFCTILGYTTNELCQMNMDDLIDEGYKPLFAETLTHMLHNEIENKHVELSLIHKNAQKLWVDLSVSLVKNARPGTTPYLIIQFQDRTEQRYFEERLLFLTTYNSLTGLLNRTSLFNKINELIQNNTIEQFTVYHMDIDRFKRVNETYGTYLGDYLLNKIAYQLKSQLEMNEIIGYLGGNEFIIINQQLAHDKELLKHGEFICSKLLKPILLQNKEVTLTASIGISQYPKHGKNLTQLLKAADMALSVSKHKGGDSCSVFNEELSIKSTNNLLIESDLRRAIDANELLVYYQPQINAQTKKPSGVEALVRWRKNGALILPDEFIPIAEESSLILKLGEEILKQGCAWFAQIQKQKKHYVPDHISINFSARQFSSPRLIPLLEKTLQEYNIEPNQLELEITETALIEHIEDVCDTLYKIGDMGIKITIDDFGTGYSSLGYLKDLPINRLKIDKSFVDSCMTDYHSQSIIASIISLAHRLGIKVTAEGVETLDQKQFLEKHHCDEFQGYYFSHPLAPKDLDHYLSQYH